jgi:hypothetical protein
VNVGFSRGALDATAKFLAITSVSIAEVIAEFLAITSDPIAEVIAEFLSRTSVLIADPIAKFLAITSVLIADPIAKFLAITSVPIAEFNPLVVASETPPLVSLSYTRKLREVESKKISPLFPVNLSRSEAGLGRILTERNIGVVDIFLALYRVFS